MRTLTKVMSLLFTLAATSANATITIDSMFAVSESGQGKFTITNNESYRQFIQVAIGDIHVVDGEIEKTPYTRENITDWSILARPARSILEPGNKKDFYFDAQLEADKERTEDRIHQFTFVPIPYFTKEENVKHSVQVAIGFAPIIIVPATKDAELDYSIKHLGDKLRIENKGGTYFTMKVDGCLGEEAKVENYKCDDNYYVLSGRTLEVALAESMQRDLDVSLSTHYGDFEKNFKLRANQTNVSE